MPGASTAIQYKVVAPAEKAVRTSSGSLLSVFPLKAGENCWCAGNVWRRASRALHCGRSTSCQCACCAMAWRSCASFRACRPTCWPAAPTRLFTRTLWVRTSCKEKPLPAQWVYLCCALAMRFMVSFLCFLSRLAHACSGRSYRSNGSCKRAFLHCLDFILPCVIVTSAYSVIC